MMVLRQTGNYSSEKRQMIIYSGDRLEAPLELAVSHLLNDRREIAMSGHCATHAVQALKLLAKPIIIIRWRNLPRPIRR